MNITDLEIESIIFSALGLKVKAISRFKTGFCHYVYDVKTEDKNIVLRMTSKDNLKYLKGAEHWLGVLKESGVEVPEVLYINYDLKKYKHYFMILERFSGFDLGYVYPDLTTESKREIVTELVKMQNKVSKVSYSEFPGEKFLPSDKLKNRTWYEYLTDISVIANRIEENDVFDFSRVTEFERIAFKYKDLLNSVKIEAYLDDITTKNVIVNNGCLTGIVDVDYISFGDRLMTIALTKMSLLKSDYDLHYVDFWIYEMDLSLDDLKLLDFYTFRYCLDFMSEIGCEFNGNNALVSKSVINRLNIIFNDLANRL